ncbi:MAG: phosphoenolpyruvate--protein phosphotransferase [Gammaproteobacteria bacterium]|nr:phosphoenolpyruvate--protein phosphotransferase [Gammaproteobacteria bacterium]
MLATLRRIVQEVNAARDLQQALSIIVTRVKQAIKVDVCTVYLFDPARDAFILMATDGLNPQAIGRVFLARGEGLVGVVGETEEPLNLDDAPADPRYRFVAETGEAYYHGFLGVPIIHHRKVMGVLVARQHDKRRFDDDEVAFLLTIAAQLSGAIALAAANGGIRGFSADQEGVESRPIVGLPGAPGIGFGSAVVIFPPADLSAIPDRRVSDIEGEAALFRAALEAARDDIRMLEHRMGDSLAAEDRALFNAYTLMLSSPSLENQTLERIRAGNWAAGALRDTIAEHTRVFDQMEDPYLRERAEDVRDVGRRILARLENMPQDQRQYPERAVLVGEEITASMLAEVPLDRLAGVVTVRGSGSSHVAILARSLGIPAVVGLSDLPVGRIDGRELIVDGDSGTLFVSPSAKVRAEYLVLAQEEERLAAELAELRDLPAITPDGIRIPLYANAGLLSDINPSLHHGAEGIGLYRTEFPFMIRNRFPSEEEQRQIYRQVLEAYAPLPVTVRTLDVGGDKMLPYFPIHEENPFLGWRGIRITLDHPEIFSVQLRAILRASIGLNNLRLLLPMISDVSEVDEALRIIRRVHQELCGQGEAVTMPETGIMIEVPSAIYQIDTLAPRVDFLSIGTNDLTQYMLAVDRNNTRVASLYDSLHPAVLRAMMQVVVTAQRCGRAVGVCGEMAGDPASALLLLGMGVSNLSASVTSLPRVKWVIHNFSIGRARDILDEVLAMEDTRSIRRHLDGLLQQAGLGSLVRAGR